MADAADVNGTTVSLSMVLVMALVFSVFALSTTGIETHWDLETRQNWQLDSTGDGLDDALAELLKNYTDEEIVVMVHYDRRPDSLDEVELKNAFGANQTYRFNNWDTVLVEINADLVVDLTNATDVWGVESVPDTSLELDHSTAVIRVTPHDLEEEGIDHNLAVHSEHGYRGEGTVIAVIDTGVDNSHSYLDELENGEPKLVQKPDPITGHTLYGGADVRNAFAPVDCIDPVPARDHGTHVASIAAGTGGEEGVHVGVAPQAKLVDIHTEAFRHDLDPIVEHGVGPVAVAMDWIMDYNAGESCYGDPADDKIDVINISWSLNTDNPYAAINRIITDTIRSGVTFVASAGNSGPDSESLTKGPEGGILVGNVRTKSTVNRSDDWIYGTGGDPCIGSSRGPRSVHINGEDSQEIPNSSKMPHVAAPGTDIEAAAFLTENGTTQKTGTSMAAPHVAGVAALMLQANTQLRPEDRPWDEMGDPGAVPIRDLLVQTAHYQTAAICGAPQHEEPGMFGRSWNNAWGYGLVDAYPAVEAALLYDEDSGGSDGIHGT